jgi:hypothetical protein
MNTLAGARRRTIVVFAALMLLMPFGTVQGASSTNFEMTVIGQTLTAGFNNNVTVTVAIPRSIYSSNSAYDVDLAVSIPSPLQLLGDGHWHYDSIAPGQSVTIEFEIYAPTAAIGNSYEGSVTLTYRELGDISYTEEAHSIAFSVHGWIDMVLYDVKITSTAAIPGGNATISGNLLNRGNIAGYNGNVTAESEAIAQGTTASVFIGEIDANIVRPFSLIVKFKKNLAPGNYSITVRVSVVDTEMPASPYTAQQVSTLQIKASVTQPPTGFQRNSSGPIEMILEILRYLYGLFFGSPTMT